MSGFGTAFIALRAIVYTTLFLGGWLWLAWWAHRQDYLLAVWLPGWTMGLGVGLMVIGAALALACVATFVVRGRGTPAPFDAPREFVATGPYRWVRNPMYIGGFLLLTGYALCAGSVAALPVAFAMLAVTHLVAVLYEEPTLRRRFGSSYEEYVRSTPRWLPRLPARRG
ncbi:MAG TPA: isoprenylcysteine carboxylmethyltransferase family protein [Gemmatimonadota bacterium]|nr:isoprenylcysteine carboxylmethyltransferase family protein [Gemmatimonadota bacterium]